MKSDDDLREEDMKKRLRMAAVFGVMSTESKKDFIKKFNKSKTVAPQELPFRQNNKL